MGGIGPEMDGAGGMFFDALINGDMEKLNPFKKNRFKVEIKEFNREKENIMEGLYIITKNLL